MKVCILGDLMTDWTVFGAVQRLSPEAPIPILQKRTEELKPGGAGNVAKNLEALMPNCQVLLAGFLSENFEGVYRNFDLTWCHWVPHMNVKLRFIDRRTGYQLIRVDNEESIGIIGSFISPGKALEMIAVEEPDVIILSDYCKGAITSALARDVICAARLEGIPVFVDTRKKNIDCFREANFITPNRHEFQEITGLPRDSTLLNKTAQLFIEDMKLDGILLTRGEQGMDLHLPGQVYHEEADKSAVIDVTGAGDSAVAAFVSALYNIDYPYVEMNKEEWKQALWIANKAAGDTCLKKGTAVPDLTLEGYEEAYQEKRTKKN